jgi:hypothetical protein
VGQKGLRKCRQCRAWRLKVLQTGRFCVNSFSVYTRNWSCHAPNASKRGLNVVSRRKCGDPIARPSKSQIDEPRLRTVSVNN